MKNSKIRSRKKYYLFCFSKLKLLNSWWNYNVELYFFICLLKHYSYKLTWVQSGINLILSYISPCVHKWKNGIQIRIKIHIKINHVNLVTYSSCPINSCSALPWTQGHQSLLESVLISDRVKVGHPVQTEKRKY